MNGRASAPHPETDHAEVARHGEAASDRTAGDMPAPELLAQQAAARAALLPANLLAVQRSAGNQAAAALVGGRRSAPRVQRDGPVTGTDPEVVDLLALLDELDAEIASGEGIEIEEPDAGEQGGDGGQPEGEGGETADGGEEAAGEVEADQGEDGGEGDDATGGEAGGSGDDAGEDAAAEAEAAVDEVEEPSPPPPPPTGEREWTPPEPPEPPPVPEPDTVGADTAEAQEAPEPGELPGEIGAEAGTTEDTTGTGAGAVDPNEREADAAEAESAAREFREAAETGEREPPPAIDPEAGSGAQEDRRAAEQRAQQLRTPPQAPPRPATESPLDGQTPAQEPGEMPGPGSEGAEGSEGEGGGESGGGDLLPAAELVEHERWGVGAAGSAERARFTAAAIGSGFGHGAYNSATTGTIISLGTLAVSRLAARRLPVPVVGSIISGIASGRVLGGQIHDLFTEEGGGSVGRSITGMAEGSSGYERAANIIDGIITILDIAGSIVDIVGGVAGIIAAIGWAGVIPSFGASSPVAVKATAIAMKCLLIAGIIGAVKIALQPLVVLFRALHTFTDEADPEQVAVRGQALEQSANALGSSTVSLARGFGTRAVGSGVRRVQARAWANRESRTQAAAAGMPPPRPRPLIRFRRDAKDRQTELDYIRHRENQRVDRLYDRMDSQLQRINALEQSGRIDSARAAQLRNDLYNRTFTLQGQAESRADALVKQAGGDTRPTTARERWRERAGSAVDALGNVGSSPSGGIKLWAEDVAGVVGSGAHDPSPDGDGGAPVDPPYPPPPATLADLDQLDHEAEALDDQAEESHDDAREEGEIREEHEENAGVISDIAGAAAEGSDARSEHAGEVDDKRAANERKAEQVDESATQLDEGSTEIAGARAMIPLVTGWRMAASGAAHILGIFSDRGAAKCRQAAADAQRFIDQLNEAIALIEAERSATPARQDETAAEADVIASTQSQGEATDEQIEQTQEAAAELQEATDEEITHAQDNEDAAETNASQAEEGAADARARRDQLESELIAWAAEHAGARHDAVAEVADSITGQGYTVTERPDW